MKEGHESNLKKIALPIQWVCEDGELSHSLIHSQAKMLNSDKIVFVNEVKAAQTVVAEIDE